MTPSLAPDVIFCFGWSRLIKKTLLNIAPLGVIGFHPALLPANRGRHPLIWSLILGLKESGSTFFFMDEGADSGDILSQLNVSISEMDDAGTLYVNVQSSAVDDIDTFWIGNSWSVGVVIRAENFSINGSAWDGRWSDRAHRCIVEIKTVGTR